MLNPMMPWLVFGVVGCVAAATICLAVVWIWFDWPTREPHWGAGYDDTRRRVRERCKEKFEDDDDE